MAKRKSKQEPELVRRDGAVCVAFVNTASAKRRSFRTYAELLAWGLACGTLTTAEVERFERAAADSPDATAAVARRAIELRSCCERVLKGLIRRRGPSDADLAMLEAELVAVRSAERLVRDGIGCRWVLGDRGGDDLDRVLWPVVTSIAEVLLSKYRFRVGQCAGKGCDLLFLDRAPGSPRRWCDRNACGSKINSRRDYRRRVKPVQEQRKRQAARRNEEYRRKLREAREAKSAGES